jgi:hypothetical protein
MSVIPWFGGEFEGSFAHLCTFCKVTVDYLNSDSDSDAGGLSFKSERQIANFSRYEFAVQIRSLDERIKK